VNYRFRGEKIVDALVEWAATSLLKLPHILYYSAKGLVTHNTHYLSNSFMVEVLQVVFVASVLNLQQPTLYLCEVLISPVFGSSVQRMHTTIDCRVLMEKNHGLAIVNPNHESKLIS